MLISLIIRKSGNMIAKIVQTDIVTAKDKVHAYDEDENQNHHSEPVTEAAMKYGPEAHQNDQAKFGKCMF